MTDLSWPLAAINTLQQPWWKIRAAQVFGRKIVAEDSGCRITAYQWRGVVYLTDCEELPKGHSDE